MSNREKKSIQTAGLVGLGNSKRLAAMRRSSMQADSVSKEALASVGHRRKATDIEQARQMIRHVIAEIKAAYPKGRQQRFFALRYVPEEQLYQMSLQEVFTLLHIKQALPKHIMQVKFKEGLG